MIVKCIDDIVNLRDSKSIDEVVIYTKRIKYKGVLPYAFKYALWALKTNGVLKIVDNGPFDLVIKPYSISFYQVIQSLHQFLGKNIQLIERNYENGIARYKVKKAISLREESKWSCGIIYSGFSSEIPQLEMCLNGIYNQDQFNDEAGEVIVCGPTDGDYTFLNKYPKNLKVLYYDNALVDGRFLITKKKNFLIERFTYQNCIVIHSRIQFKKEAINNIPENFEFICPQIFVDNGFSEVRYLDFILRGAYDSTRVVAGKIVSSDQYKPENYLKNLKYGLPYIDGAIMIFKKDILLDCPLNPDLAWGENEDVDLASRLHLHGYLIDFAFNSHALSTSNKTIQNKYKKYIEMYKVLYTLNKIRNNIKSKCSVIINRMKFNTIR